MIKMPGHVQMWCRITTATSVYKFLKNVNCISFIFISFKNSDQSLVKPVAVVVVQTSSKIIRQLTGFDVASQLIGRNQDHLTGGMKRAY